MQFVYTKRETVMVPCFFLLMVLSFPFLSSSAQTNSSVQLGCGFNSVTWYNSNSTNEIIDYGSGYSARVILKTNSSYPHFACAFICTGATDSYFLAVLILGKFDTSAVDNQGGFPGLVWLANREQPIRESGLLQLTSNGGLMLQDSDGTIVWSTGTNGKSVLGLRLEETGNLQLCDEQNYMVWQSFDCPSDTLLPGQKLYEGQKLTASASAKNWSSGQYHVEMTSTAFAAFVEADGLLMYFKLDQESAWLRPNASHEQQRIDWKASSRRPNNYAQLDGKNLILTIQGNNHIFVASPDCEVGSYLYLKLGFDGHLRIYIWKENYALREAFDLVAQGLDNCQYPHYCGEYGVCRSSAECICPKASDGLEYFTPINRQLPNRGCSAITPLSCQSPANQHHLVDFGNYSYFNFIDSDAAEPKSKDLEGCKQACLRKCSCKAAFFVHTDNASYGSCYLPSKIMSMREKPLPSCDSNSFAFIKVQIPSSPPSPQPASSSPSERKLHSSTAPPEVSPGIGQKKSAKFAGSALDGTGVVFILTALCTMILLTRTQMKKEKEDNEDFFEPVVGMPTKFSYEDLCIATKDFKEKLGRGGFGSVFKGTLQDGMNIAVKRLDKIGQGGMKEFLAEVETIGNIHHFNLVRLIGFCAERSHRLLVYEYMNNGSLDKWIFSKDDNLTLDWQTRKKIMLDVAKGLAYLHEECRHRIVHLDIKPQNILLDENFNAKLSDFGLSKLMDREQSQVQTTLRGTPGYLAPEWQQLRITFKADIYSFGIVVLEIVCGRKNLDRSRSGSSKHLLRLLQEKAKENHLIEILDGLRADIQFHREEVLKMIKVATWCLQDDPRRRPMMSMVVRVLEGAMEVEPNISYRFRNALGHSSTSGDDFHMVSNLPWASVLSGPR